MIEKIEVVHLIKSQGKKYLEVFRIKYLVFLKYETKYYIFNIISLYEG